MPTRTRLMTAVAATSVAGVAMTVALGGVVGAGSPQGAGAGRVDTENVFVATGSTKNNGNSGNSNCKGAQNAVCDGKITVTVGSVSDAYPGSSQQPPVTVTNPNNFDVYVAAASLTLSAQPGASTADGSCTVSDWQVNGRPFAPAVDFTYTDSPLKVAKNGSSTVLPLTVGLIPDPREACQGQTFALTATVTAVKR